MGKKLEIFKPRIKQFDNIYNCFKQSKKRDIVCIKNVN